MPDFVDVLPLLTAACTSLPHNVLIQSTKLDFFEVTSSIEIGETRMDCGALAIAQGDVAEPGEPHFQLREPMLPVEVVWIMDRVLEAEMTWQSGSALAQTLWTCVYMLDTDSLGEELDSATSERPSELTTLVLRAHLRACLKTCDIVMEELLKRHVRDIEDFQGDKAGISLLEDVEIDTVLDELHEAYEWLMEWDGDLADRWRMSLLTRIRLRMELLCAICLFAISDPAYEAIPSHLLGVQQAFDYIRKSPPLYPEDFTVPSALNAEYARRLERSAPPRPLIQPLSTRRAWELLQSLIDGISDAVKLRDMQSWCEIEAHFLQVARKQPAALPYIRSLHQTVFYSNKTVCTRLPLKWLGMSFLQDHAGCPTSAFESELIASSRLPAFIENISGYLVEYIAALSSNRARSYRMLGKCLASWQSAAETATRLVEKYSDDLQVVARTEEGSSFEPASIFSAMQRMQYTIVLEIQVAGFELELYSPDEYFFVYWYMAHCARIFLPHARRLASSNPTIMAQPEDSSGWAKMEQTRSIAYGDLAEAGVILLLLSKTAPTVDSKLDRTRFKRRFAWAPSDGIFAIRWEEYERYVGNLHELDRAELMERAMESLSKLQETASTLSPDILSTVLGNTSVLLKLSPKGRLNMLPQIDWSTPLFPEFQAMES